MSDSRRGIARKRGTPRAVQPIVRVHSEGTKTEIQMLTEWVRETRRVKLDWGILGADPKALVDAARQNMKKANRDRSGVNREFDHLWCVFDVDEHPRLRNALEEARQSNINVAISNPCIELWLLLHIDDQTAHIERADAQRQARNEKIQDGKDIRPQFYGRMFANYETARARAQDLDKKHELDGSPPHHNPSSNIWRLIDLLREPA